MRSICNFFGLMMLGWLCSGCLKLEHNITSPGASGIVLDARTHSPLSGAQVVVSRTEFWTNAPTVADALANTRPPIVTTGKSGRFHIPVEGHWNLIVDYLIAPRHPPGGTLVVQRTGYQPVVVPLWRGIVPIGVEVHATNFIEVLLSPITK